MGRAVGLLTLPLTVVAVVVVAVWAHTAVAVAASVLGAPVVTLTAMVTAELLTRRILGRQQTRLALAP